MNQFVLRRVLLLQQGGTKNQHQHQHHRPLSYCNVMTQSLQSVFASSSLSSSSSLLLSRKQWLSTTKKKEEEEKEEISSGSTASLVDNDNGTTTVATTVTFTTMDDDGENIHVGSNKEDNDNDDDDTQLNKLDVSQFTQEIHITMPDMGESTAKVVKWYKKEGDLVQRNDVLCDIETKDFTFGLTVDDEEDGIMGTIVVPAITATAMDEEGTTDSSSTIKDGDLLCILLHRGDDDDDDERQTAPSDTKDESKDG